MSEGWWVLGGVLVGALASGGVSLLLQNRQFLHNLEMYDLKKKGEVNVKTLLTEMLSHKSYIDRTFEALRKAVGGYNDDELRKLLHEAGAKRVYRKDGTEEWWYLSCRQGERIAKLK